MTPEERAQKASNSWLRDYGCGLPLLAWKRLDAEIAAAIREAVKAEREKNGMLCQQLADAAAQDIADQKTELGEAYDVNCYGSGFDEGARATAAELAAAIRERPL